MTRTIELALNAFTKVPPTLLDPKTKGVTSPITFDAKSVLHHYFVAKYGDDTADPCCYEYEIGLTSGPDWRFRKGGIGRDTESKRNISNELGKGFARWFLYEHLGFTYFCPLGDLLDRKNADGSRWTRVSKGDLPDYVCGPDDRQVHLLEAKGRYSPVAFNTQAFAGFRAQIQRAALLDGKGAPISVKGFISAARWATERSPRIRARLNVEDPRTEGREVGQEGFPRPVGVAMVVGHYSPVLTALNLPIHAAALRSAGRAPERAGVTRGIWRCNAGPLEGRRFVGGIVAEPGAHVLWPFWFDWYFEPPTRLQLRTFPFFLAPSPRFFGVEEHVFHQVLDVSRGGIGLDRVIEPINVPEETRSLSLLRDGTVLGPARYFEPVDVIDL
jgi:hypothetical protein